MATMQNYVLDDYQKGINTVADNNTCYDKPDKRQKHPHFDHRTTKMMTKNNEFTEKKFQKIRHVSNKKKILKSFKRIGRCLNHVSRDEMPKEGYDKVCLILMNNIHHKKHDPKIGALNDGYLFGLYHHRLGFRVFYLYNCVQGNYPKYLQFFLHNTQENLTVFYSGPSQLQNGAQGLEFKNMDVTTDQIAHLIARDNNGKCKVVFVSDSTSSGTVFDISKVTQVGNPCPSPMLSFQVNKNTDPDSKEGRRSHGVFTYYFCKVVYDEPSVTARRVVERLNGFMNRLGHSVSCNSTDPAIMEQPMYNPNPHPEEPQDDGTNEDLYEPPEPNTNASDDEPSVYSEDDEPLSDSD